MTEEFQTKPNGPAAAVTVAAGAGAFVVGLLATLADANDQIKNALDFSKNYGLGNGVGPLSGKVALATITFFAVWAILGFVWRGKEVSFGRAFAAGMILLALGFILTFPPAFELIADTLKGS